MQYQSSFDESADGYLLPVIEEGVADGSIACECPREAAEAVSLLANLWLLPLFRPLEPKERMVARAQCLTQMAAAVGLDLGEEVLQTTCKFGTFGTVSGGNIHTNGMYIDVRGWLRPPFSSR